MAGISGFANTLNLVDDTGGTVTSVDVSGGTTGLTTSGGPVTTAGTITIAGTLGAANGGTGVANGAGSTITLGGAFSVAGAFSLALTLTAGTALTLPTSGTLATTTDLASYLPLAGGTMTGVFGGKIGTVGAPSFFAAGSATTGLNFLTGGATIQEVISGVAVTTVTAALLTVTGTLNVNAGTITTSQPVAITQTWNAAGVTFKGFTISVPDQAANAGSASGSLLLDLLCGTAGTTSVFSVGKTGIVTNASHLQVGNNAVYIDASVGRVWVPGTGGYFGFSSNTAATSSSTIDTLISKRAAANINFGAADVASGAVAQTISFQGNTGATTTGPLATIVGAGGGTGAGSIGGELRLQGGLTAAAGTGGAVSIWTAPAAAGATPALGFSVASTGSVIIGNAALVTTATDGFLYIDTCAGAPTGVPTAVTGRVPIIYDTTNDQLYIYRGGWKQPKTPAAAALITWQ